MPREDPIATSAEVRHFNEPRGIIVLWFSVLIGPIAWAGGLNAGYSLVLVACGRGTMLPLHLVSLATLALAILGAAVGWREWRRAGLEIPGEGPGAIPRSRFMAALGLIGSIYFALVILAQWVGSLMIHPCMGL